MMIILDTNFFFLPFYEHFDVVNELRKFFPKASMVILEEVLDEVDKLEKRGVKWAGLVKEYIKKRKIRVVRYGVDEFEVDKKILKYAGEHNAFIGTIDKDLKKKAVSKNIKIISFLKSKKKLIIPEDVM
jgi:rRNA-processing protein FCF1